MVICLERAADLHMAQLMPLPLTVSCFSKIQIDFTFLVPAHPGSPGQRAVKRVCVWVCVCLWMTSYLHTMGRGGLSVPFQRVTSLRRRVRANAPAASYYLCRVPDVGGRRD